MDYSQLAIDIENDVGWASKSDKQIADEMNAITQEVPDKAQWTELGLYNALDIATADKLMNAIEALAGSQKIFDMVLRTLKSHADGNGIDLSAPRVAQMVPALGDPALGPLALSEDERNAVLALGRRTINKYSLNWRDVMKARKKRA